MKMNPLLTHCFAAILAGGVLSVPSYSLADACNDKESHVMKRNVIDNVTELKSEYAERNQIVNKLADEINAYYFNLLEMDDYQAHGVMLQNGFDENKACEAALRGFENVLKVMVKQGDLSDEEKTEMKSYLRTVAKARYAIARLNDFSRQLFTIPKTFESDIDFNALGELADYTTKKIISGDYSFTG
ncbi:hypothetical protein [Providencia huaxiensis]|uniref:hypothetical protein n=2 Tax=Providencia huaxiensis TaxID=2027290 RepID=UPI0034E48986